MQRSFKHHLKTLFVTSLLLQGMHTIYAEESEPIILTSRVLKFVDGIPHTMDGHSILGMKYISHKLRAIIYGQLDPQTKKRIGMFEFQDKKASLHTLSRIEERIQTTYKTAREKLEQKYMDVSVFATKWQAREHALIEQFETQIHKIEEEIMTRHKSEKTRDLAIKQATRKFRRKHETLVQDEIEKMKKDHIQEFEQFTRELVELEHKCAQQYELLAPALAQAKQMFADITLPFMEQAQGSKEFMVPLIEEWAEKAGHKDSMLLRWSEEDPGSELKMFDHDITTCTDLNNMCENLLDFLSSIIASCPIAFEQYEKLKAKLSHTHDPVHETAHEQTHDQQH